MKTKVAKAGLFFVIVALLTLTGWYFSWSQVHLQDWKGTAAIVLLLPYAVVNRVFHLMFHSEPLSPSLYHLAFFLGSLGQLLYYFAIFAGIKRFAKIAQPRPPS